MRMNTFSTLKPMSIGFDDFFRYAESLIENDSNAKFPPYNILRMDEYNFLIELALAGYSKEDIEITTHDGLLSVSCSKQAEPTADYTVMHRGISARAFTKTFTLADNIIVKGADFLNGMLSIKLERVVPEEKRPKTISIN